MLCGTGTRPSGILLCRTLGDFAGSYSIKVPPASTPYRAKMSLGEDLRARFYADPVTGSPHIYGHDVNEEEGIDVLGRPDEDRNGREGSRVALGQTASGRYLRVIYVPDPERDSVFVITAYELSGKPLAAFRRRRKKKHQ